MTLLSLLLFRAGTNLLNAMIFSSLAYALYKDPSLDLRATRNEWDEYSATFYTFLKGLMLQYIYLITGWAWYPAMLIHVDNLILKGKEFYSSERREMSTSHDLIELYRRGYGSTIIIIILLLHYHYHHYYRYRSGIVPMESAWYRLYSLLI